MAPKDRNCDAASLNAILSVEGRVKGRSRGVCAMNCHSGYFTLILFITMQSMHVLWIIMGPGDKNYNQHLKKYLIDAFEAGQHSKLIR